MSDGFVSIAIVTLHGCWPQSQECNGLLHYDWRNGKYYSDFYGEHDNVQFICTKEQFEKARKEQQK